MSYATKFNRGNKFNVKPAEDVHYLSLEELYRKDASAHYNVKALYINTKSRFGEAPAVLIDPLMIVNLPKHLLATVKDMIADDECVNAINNGEVSFEIYIYNDSTFNKTCYGVKWL